MPASKSMGRLPFDGVTTYKTDYLKWPAQMMPVPARMSHQPFPDTRDFRSTYKGDYLKKPLPVRPVCPVTLLPPYPYPCEPRRHIFWDPVAQKWY